MVGLGVSQNSAEHWLFIAAHISFLLCLFWTLGYWLTSATLQDRNPYSWSKQRRKSQDLRRAQTAYLWWKWVGCASVLCIYVTATVGTHVLWEKKKLSQMYGVLIPANEPDPPFRRGCERPQGALAVYYGNSVAYFKERHFVVMISVAVKKMFGEQEKSVLWAEQDKGGNILLNADFRSPDGKEILLVSRNSFWINDNNIFKSLSLHPDESTIDLADLYGNKLSVRYLNRGSLRVSGKFFIGPNAAVDIRENGDTIAPGFIYSNGCNMDMKHAVFSFVF